MKKYIILAMFSCLILVSSTGMDTIPRGVEARARQLTDSQLVAMSDHTGYDRWVVHFDRLREHIDSSNARLIVMADSLSKASSQRDSVMTALMITIGENIRLEKENKEYRENMAYALSQPVFLFYFLLMVAAAFVAKGIERGIRAVRKRKSNQETDA